MLKLERRGYTFPRNIIAARANVSLFNTFKGGIHFYKGKDDYNEINRTFIDAKVNNKSYNWYESIISLDTLWTGDSVKQTLTISELLEKTSLDSSSKLFGDSIYIKKRNWGNGDPKENLVLGLSLIHI